MRLEVKAIAIKCEIHSALILQPSFNIDKTGFGNILVHG
jgi:hypothetical protein